MMLANERHEQFCLAMVEHGGSWKKVMKAVGYKESQQFFSQLKHKPQVQTRIEELQKAAVSVKVAALTERLELLTVIARDVNLPKGPRIAAIRELHIQSGDAIQKIEHSGSTESIIKHVDLAYPVKEEANEATDIKDTTDYSKLNKDALELELEAFLKELDEEHSGVGE